MNIKYVSLEDITGGPSYLDMDAERQFPLRLATSTGAIHMDASESELRNMLTQITNILENK